MTNRREFLRFSLAASMLPLAMPALAAGADIHKLGALRLERFVVDARFADAVAVARQVAQQGVEFAEIHGDLTDLWYRHFDLQWKRAPMTLAGMTDWHGLFVLETLAADQRMRVIYRGEHVVAKHGSVAHYLAGPSDLLEQIGPALDAPHWQASLGTAMTQCVVEVSSTASMRFGLSGSSISNTMPFPEHAPAAILRSGNTVMS